MVKRNELVLEDEGCVCLKELGLTLTNSIWWKKIVGNFLFFFKKLLTNFKYTRKLLVNLKYTKKLLAKFKFAKKEYIDF